MTAPKPKRCEYPFSACSAAAELAECRAKLAAQIERCGFAELAETQRALERDNAWAKLVQAEAETARVRAMLDEDEALRDAVRENLPECTCDADGNLGGEVDRVEFAGEELRRALAKLAQAEQRGREDERETTTKALKWADSLAICYENLVEGLYDEAVAKDQNEVKRYWAWREANYGPEWCTCNDSHTCEGHRA